MRVLVTRPQPAAAATAERLAALGHQAIILPMMTAVHQLQAAREALALPHSALAFTSAEAVRALAAIRDRLAPCLQTPVFCVGPATAEAASLLGFQSVSTGPGTGAGLAALISRCLTNPEHGLVYLAGSPRSPGFETALREAAIPCRVAEVYRMVPMSYAPGEIGDLIRSKKPDIALFYSHETARHFFSLLAPFSIAPGIKRLLCLSQHVADAVPQGFGNIAVAAQPDEDSLLALI